MRTKRLDKSHLTEQEKRHTVALVALGVLLIVTTFGINIFYSHIPFYPTDFPLVIGMALIMFGWGYIGAMEDERSGKP